MPRENVIESTDREITRIDERDLDPRMRPWLRLACIAVRLLAQLVHNSSRRS